MLTEDKQKRSEERRRREVEKFKANIAIPRPGTSSSQPLALPVLEKHGVELSDILYLPLAELRDNPLNDYPPLPEDELEELTADIREKGILVPLIAKLDGTLVCGHNRKAAGLRAGVDRAPVQQILSPLSAALEKDIMKSENDRRRGGRWSKEQKEKFIQENFGEDITRTDHGGARANAGRKSGNQGSMNLEKVGPTEEQSLAKKIEKQSRGRITSGTAKRIVADLRKKAPKRPGSGSERLPARDRRRGEKLRARLKVLESVKQALQKKLENVRNEIEIVRAELRPPSD